jgi:ribosomal protein L37E
MRRRVDEYRIEVGDCPLLSVLLSQLIDRMEARQARAIVKSSKIAADAATGRVIDAEYSEHESKGGEPSSGSDASSDGASQSETRGDCATNEQGAKKPKGHGRNGTDAFGNAKHFFYALTAGVIGALCAACGFGRTYRYREKVIIRVIGQPMFGAEAHHYEQARCRECGRIIRADGPSCVHEGVGSDYIRYDWSACAMLLVLHYFGGQPFKRLESLHAGWGIPMADANQWQVANRSDDLLLPVYRAHERHAIQKATNFRIDDTGAMVIALQKQIAAEIATLEQLGESTKSVRTGINATGIYWETPDGPIILFFTGRHHAGEMVDQLLRHRLLSSPKLVKCTDGASKNFDHEHADKLVESTCNAHAFLKFRDIKDKHPAEYAEAGRIYKQVFDNDDKAAALGLSSVDRMLYHRKHSLPLMQELRKMCAAKIERKLVEPNAPLWEPLTFIINQWDRLTRFCEVPGVPLDTNLVEQALIMPVRYLNGSFNYQSVDGAVVGDHVMSLIATARAHGVEPVAYLAECLRCHEDLAQRPEYYLPWAYKARLEKSGSIPSPARESPLTPSPESTSAASS